jgi:hypothetical protein
MDGEDLLPPSLPTAVFATTLSVLSPSSSHSQIRMVIEFIIQQSLPLQNAYSAGEQECEAQDQHFRVDTEGGGGVRPKELLTLVSEQCKQKNSRNTMFRAEEIDISHNRQHSIIAQS